MKTMATTMRKSTRVMLSRTTVPKTAPRQVTPLTALFATISPTIFPATGVAISRCSQDAQLATSSPANTASNASAKHRLNGNVPPLSPRLWPGSYRGTGDARRKHNNIQYATSKIPSQWNSSPTLFCRSLPQRLPRRVLHRSGNNSKIPSIKQQLWIAPVLQERPPDNMTQRRACHPPSSRTSHCPSWL